jgi:hypothetical protein
VTGRRTVAIAVEIEGDEDVLEAALARGFTRLGEVEVEVGETTLADDIFAILPRHVGMPLDEVVHTLVGIAADLVEVTP